MDCNAYMHDPASYWTLRRLVNKLAKLFALLDVNPEMTYRADGNCICEVCGDPYWRHATHPIEPCLAMLCDGRNVKL